MQPHHYCIRCHRKPGGLLLTVTTEAALHLLAAKLDARQSSQVEPAVRGRRALPELLAENCLKQVSGAISAQNRHVQKCDKDVITWTNF